MNTLLPDRAREIVDEGAIITIGATTMILRTEQPESDD